MRKQGRRRRDEWVAIMGREEERKEVRAVRWKERFIWIVEKRLSVCIRRNYEINHGEYKKLSLCNESTYSESPPLHFKGSNPTS